LEIQQKILCLLDQFSTVSLEGIAKNALMDRVDEKFVFPIQLLHELLLDCQQEYHVLEIDKRKLFQYSSLYFDDKQMHFFKDHHNGKSIRNKVRIRKYCDVGTSYLEIKKKLKQRTIKKRIQIADLDPNLSEESLDYIKKHIPNDAALIPILHNNYKRITLVHKTREERLTFDFDMHSYSIDNQEEKSTLSNLVIAEIKQPRINRNTLFFQLMRAKQIRPLRISKFCFGVIELYHNLALKSNRFKPRMIQLQKVLNQSNRLLLD
jgi:hypothetical protein